jgi:antitoxin (DNA-binding transcriptional repressor) of toxin-antitoxin stability system
MLELIDAQDIRDRGREIIDRVKAGEIFVVTMDGKPVGRLEPFADDDRADDAALVMPA